MVLILQGGALRRCPPDITPCPQHHWQRPDGQPATREHLMMALADLDEILIRATYASSTAWAAIAALSMDTAVPPRPGLPPAPEVEECRCPPGYRGLSCQVSRAYKACRPGAACTTLHTKWGLGRPAWSCPACGLHMCPRH